MEDVFIGTEIKLNISIAPIGDVTMDDYDFYIEVYCSAKRAVMIQKSNTIRIDENNRIICVDTTSLGAGEIKCKITAYIPDADFPDNKRTEVVAINTGIQIIKSI